MPSEEQADFEPHENRDSAHWHLDKKVPISIIVALFFQTLGFIYVGTAWKTEIDFRINSLEKFTDERKNQESRIVAVEQQIRFIAETVQRIDRRLDTGPSNGNQQ